MPRRVFFFCILLLVLAVLYTLSSAWITVGRIERLDAAGKAAAQSQQVLSALHAFATAAVDIESGARGYALTGNEGYLQPFEAGRRQAPMRLDELRDLLRDDPKQLAKVERLTALIAERISISEHGVSQKRSAPEEPFALRLGTRGRETSEEIRRIVEDLAADERHDLSLRKIAWQQELESARTTEALSALSSLTVITLSLWALLRLRRIELPATAPLAAAPPAKAAAPPPPADLETLTDETLRRAALLQASHPSGSAERARVEMLREAVEAARAGISPTQALLVLERLGLPLALSALARGAQRRGACALHESIDASAPSLSAANALLVFRAADWALAKMSAHPAAEIGVAMAADGPNVVLRIETSARAARAEESEDERATQLARELAAVGGSWQWASGDAGQSLTVTIPARDPADAPAAEAASAPA